MLASSAPPTSFPTVLFPECISPDIPCICLSGVVENPRPCNRLSALPHGQDEIGGAVPGPYRPFDGCRQPRISPVAGEKQVFLGRRGPRPQSVLLRRGLKCGTAFAHDLPGRQLARYVSSFADIPPDRL